MGQERDLTLDSGALVQFEKRDRKAWAILGAAMAAGVRMTVPVVVVAQVHRGNSPAVARVLNACALEPLTYARAREVGLLLADAGTNDIVDSAVVLSALGRGDDIVTSDPKDIARLIEAAGAKGAIDVVPV